MNEERDNHRVDVRWLEKFIFGTETTHDGTVLVRIIGGKQIGSHLYPEGWCSIFVLFSPIKGSANIRLQSLQLAYLTSRSVRRVEKIFLKKCLTSISRRIIFHKVLIDPGRR